MPTLQELANNFCEDNEIQYVELVSQRISSLEKINIGTNKSFFTKLKEYPYEFEINSSLQLASIDGVKISNIQDNSNKELQETIAQMQRQIEDLNNKIVILQENNKKLEQNEETLKKLIEDIKSDKIKYTVTELARTTSTTNKTVNLNSNLQDYKYVMIARVTGNVICPSGWLTIEQFRSGGIMVRGYEDTGATCNYINDTNCELRTFASGSTTILYGIK